MTSIRPCDRTPQPAYLPNKRSPSTLQFVQGLGSRLHQACTFRKRLRDLECDNRRIEKHVAVYSCQVFHNSSFAGVVMCTRTLVSMPPAPNSEERMKACQPARYPKHLDTLLIESHRPIELSRNGRPDGFMEDETNCVRLRIPRS